MSTFVKGDFVKDSKGNIGKVTSITSMGVYVFSATTGQNDCFSEAAPATEQEYKEAVDRRLFPPKKPSPAKQPQAISAKVVAPKQRTYQYRCLSCNRAHNSSRECPHCGGEDWLYNTDKDAPASIGHAGKSDAPLYPEEG